MTAIQVRYERVLSIGDVIRIALPAQTRDDPTGPRFGDLALVGEGNEAPRLAQVVRLDEGAATRSRRSASPWTACPRRAAISAISTRNSRAATRRRPCSARPAR
jgi:hypothetical protein